MPSDEHKLDQAVAAAQRNRAEREKGYRERALKMYPWICGRCSREFTRENLHELTVHHRDHDHDNNPEDGSNWELLCIYCHDNEHARFTDAHDSSVRENRRTVVTYRPFEGLADFLKKED